MNILLATDGSEYSELAARFLRRFRWSRDDNITVFHALYWIPFRYDEEFYLSTLKDLKKELAPRVLDSIVKILKPLAANIGVAIQEGAPEKCIIDAAVNSDEDMIVLGARGIKGAESFFVGSVTRSVANDSPKPVLVVKPRVNTASDTMRVLFAADGSDHSYATGEFLSEIPFPDDTEVTILHVIWSNVLDIPVRFAMEADERTKEFMTATSEMEFAKSERITEQAAEHFNRRFKKVHILSKVGDPSAEILSTAETIGADVIAMGCRGLRGIKKIMGSVSRNILIHSKSCVLIGKACE
ncbi:MAG: universal stress protein [Nitrospirae bacterium]|nr:universal stress protein [Nitrospirota bacterium]